jgi:predicted metalloprotease with PDZ domain
MPRLFIALATLLLIGAKAPDVVDYTLSPVFEQGGLVALDVTVRMRAGTGGATKFALPNNDGAANGLSKYLKDVRAEGGVQVIADGPAGWKVVARPGAPLILHYRVVSAFDHDPGPKELDTYKPTIRPHWFWAYGEALFLRPDMEGVQARFTWTGAKDYPFASDLEHGAGKPMPLDDLTQSVAVGGPDVEVIRREAGGAPVRVAMIGPYAAFSHQAFAEMAARVIEGERRFWNSKEGPFLVALGPLTPIKGWRSSRGEGRGDAFAIMTTSDIPLADLRSTLAHEYFHTWNPHRLGGIRDGTKQRLDYWFSEGFTDFYARRLLLRMGAASLEDFAAEWNDALGRYAASPARTAPNSRVAEAFWTDQAVEKLPYQRGSILAAKWDSVLRERSHGRTSLDDILQAMRADVLAHPQSKQTAPDRFVAISRRFGLDVRPDIASVIERGEPALLPANAFGDCLSVETATVPIFDYGFDTGALGTDRVIRGVKPDHPAYAAGLRDGMVLVKRESPGAPDSRTPLTLRVKVDGAERTVTYSPAGKTTITLQTVIVPPSLSASRRAACTEVAAGKPFEMTVQ